jgi:hypothetical protein
MARTREAPVSRLRSGSISETAVQWRWETDSRAAFHGIDRDLMQKALQVLVKRGKAQIFGQEDQQGVKFF